MTDTIRQRVRTQLDLPVSPSLVQCCFSLRHSPFDVYSRNSSVEVRPLGYCRADHDQLAAFVCVNSCLSHPCSALHGYLYRDFSLSCVFEQLVFERTRKTSTANAFANVTKRRFRLCCFVLLVSDVLRACVRSTRSKWMLPSCLRAPRDGKRRKLRKTIRSNLCRPRRRTVLHLYHLVIMNSQTFICVGLLASVSLSAPSTDSRASPVSDEVLAHAPKLERSPRPRVRHPLCCARRKCI